MTKAPTPTEQSKKQRPWQHKNATKNFDYTTIADRLRTVSWSNSSHQTGVVKPVYERSTLIKKINVGPLWRVWHHKPIRSESTLSIPSYNYQFATWMTWTGVITVVEELIHTKANSSQIHSSKFRPVWSWSICLCIVWILYFILNQWKYNKTIIDWGFEQHMIIRWTFRQNAALITSQ